MARLTTSILLTVLLALGFLMIGSAAEIDPTSSAVALGSDYFNTLPDTQFNLGPGIGNVNFVGLPIGPGNSDTIDQRKADAIINGPAVPLQFVGLSLESTAPVNVGGNFFDIFVTLDPANLAKDTGTIAFAGTAAGGTFTSNVTVFIDAHFAPTAAGTAFDAFDSLTLANSGAMWGPNPNTPNTLFVNGPDDGSAADQAANRHSGLLCNAQVCEVDFFLNGPFIESNGPNVAHGQLASTPEPASLLLFGSALVALGLKLKLRRSVH